VQVITDRDALLAHRPDDVFARASLAPGTPLVGYALGEAIGWVRTSRHRGLEFLTVSGETADAVALAVAADAALPTPAYGLTVPRAAAPLLPDGLRPAEGTDWDFWWTDAPPPPQPGEEGVHWLTADDGELLALLERASPRRMASPGDPHVLRWCGIRDGAGVLVACAAEVDDMANAPHLAGVAVAPESRSRGLGRAITAWLTRQILAEGQPLVTLGMYADNEPARRAYRAIGYRDTHHWSSGRTPAGDAAAARQP
jgi:ribosomal protein S18 acetylase RimI-like enzyme